MNLLLFKTRYFGIFLFYTLNIYNLTSRLDFLCIKTVRFKLNGESNVDVNFKILIKCCFIF